MFGKMFEKEEKRFQLKEKVQDTVNGPLCIMVDTLTGVNYLIMDGISSFGMTPLLDENGNVVIDK